VAEATGRHPHVPCLCCLADCCLPVLLHHSLRRRLRRGHSQAVPAQSLPLLAAAVHLLLLLLGSVLLLLLLGSVHQQGCCEAHVETGALRRLRCLAVVASSREAYC
jgi:hypothetical protein